MDLSAMLCLLLCFCSVLRTQSSAIQPVINGANAALMYLSRFGYIDPSVTNPESGALMTAEAVRQAILDFQAFAGLNQTGTLDDKTTEMMNTPRCGVVDKVGYGSNARKKRYALQGSRWKVNDLTYRITKYPKMLSRHEVDRDVQKAFEVWSQITELSFTASSSGKVHIEIRFERAEHGDGDPFDGPGGTLAHAYFPIYGGDAHFDDSESWTVSSYKGTNLFQVAAHEFGHSLGLSHSDVQSALMAPFYRGYQAKFSLDDDDITAIQSLYGKTKTKDTRPPVVVKTPSVYPSPSGGGGDALLCKDGSIDAIITTSDKATYVFKGNYYYKLSDDRIADGYPKKIHTDFGGLPSNIDAAFTWNNGKTYFFKDSKYWRYTGFTMDDEYPKHITKGFAGIPNNVDAAFVWSGNGKIYFFKGKDYYKFDPAQRPPVAEKYPKDIALWDGLPYAIDDAMQYSNGYTYFFKDGQYWRFNDRGFKVDYADPPFPRPVGPWWFGCPDKGSQHSDSEPPLDDDSAVGDVYYDDSFIADGSNDNSLSDDLNPKMGYSRSYDNGATSSVSFSLSFSWFIIPFLLRYVCA